MGSEAKAGANSGAAPNGLTEIELKEFEEDLKAYQLFRTRVNEEYAFINHRLTWLLVVETMLFTAIGLWKDEGLTKHMFWTLVACGLAFTFVSVLAIGAAQAEIRHLKSRYSQHFVRAASNPRLLPLTGKTWHHILGSAQPPILGIIVLVLWIGVGNYAMPKITSPAGTAATPSSDPPAPLP